MNTVEARMHHREHEVLARSQELLQRPHERIDFCHVHERHGGDGSVETAIAERQQGRLVGRVEYVVLDAA